MIPGYSNQRQLELLVEEGFTPLEAITIGTLNGAKYLGRDRQIGSIAAGKQADLHAGRRAIRPALIADVRNVDTVFRQGIGFDPAKLISVGHRPRRHLVAASRTGSSRLEVSVSRSKSGGLGCAMALMCLASSAAWAQVPTPPPTAPPAGRRDRVEGGARDERDVRLPVDARLQLEREHGDLGWSAGR